MVKNTPKAELAAIEKKKKRPWRNKVRKQAQKEAARVQKLESEPAQTETEETAAKKIAKKKEKKLPKPVQSPESTVEDVEMEAEAVQPSKKPKLSKMDEFKEKLDSGRFRFLNEQLYTTTGAESFEYFKENPEAFEAYHKGFAKQVEKWPNHPLQIIIKWLQNQKEAKTVYDLGCGEAKIAEAVGSKHQIQSFDLVAVNDRVTVADMANLPVEDSSADVVIFCLSLMGTNILDFVKEARRVLKTGGTLKIAEVTSRFHNLKRFCDAIRQLGFTQTERREVTDYFVMLQFTKIAKVENKRPLGLKLKPCLYKKR